MPDPSTTDEGAEPTLPNALWDLATATSGLQWAEVPATLQDRLLLADEDELVQELSKVLRLARAVVVRSGLHDVDHAATSTVVTMMGEDDSVHLWHDEHDEASPESGVWPWPAPAPEVALLDGLWEGWEAQRRRVLGMLDGCDPTTGTPAQPCPTWSGYISPPSTRYLVALPVPATGDRPGYTLSVDYGKDTPEEAQAIIGAWPETFAVVPHNRHLVVMVNRADLIVEEQAMRGHVGSCVTCGHERTEHADEGTPIVPSALRDAGRA